MTSVHCRVVSDAIDPQALIEEIVAPSDGAVLLFLGVVRNENGGREVDHLEYEAYVDMAERTLDQIVAAARERWSVGEIRVVHRIGRLSIGEVSVAIAVASPHRGDGYEASRFIIEELKVRVPIWKREGYVQGETGWLPGMNPTLSGQTNG